MFKKKIKIWNKIKYELGQGRWKRISVPLSWDVWNFYNPDNKIEYKDGNVIHHRNGDCIDDRIENLQKMTRSKHTILHKTGNCYGNKNRENRRIVTRLLEYGKRFYCFSIVIDNFQYRETITILKSGEIRLYTELGVIDLC